MGHDQASVSRLLLDACPSLFGAIMRFSEYLEHLISAAKMGYPVDRISIITNDLFFVIRFRGSPRKLFYFPMQNVLKIRFRMSSTVVAPVMASSGRKAL